MSLQQLPSRRSRRRLTKKQQIILELLPRIAERGGDLTIKPYNRGGLAKQLNTTEAYIRKVEYELLKYLRRGGIVRRFEVHGVIYVFRCSEKVVKRLVGEVRFTCTLGGESYAAEITACKDGSYKIVVRPKSGFGLKGLRDFIRFLDERLDDKSFREVVRTISEEGDMEVAFDLSECLRILKEEYRANLKKLREFGVISLRSSEVGDLIEVYLDKSPYRLSLEAKIPEDLRKLLDLKIEYEHLAKQVRNLLMKLSRHLYQETSLAKEAKDLEENLKQLLNAINEILKESTRMNLEKDKTNHENETNGR